MKLYIEEVNVKKDKKGKFYLALNDWSVMKVVFLGQLYLSGFVLVGGIVLGIIGSILF